MSLGLLLLATGWWAGLLAVLAVILFTLRAIYRIPIVSKVPSRIEIDIYVRRLKREGGFRAPAP
jgi:hypothetical protein